ncbi:hypothetical protein FRC09_005646, partial [Ceratobasidium sp. 395]
MTWQGLGHTINKFRMKRLGLSYLNTQSAVGMLERCGVPWTYCLSPALVPRPADWMSHIDVVGFYFLDLAKGYTPPHDLERFLAAGEAPIYVGFGSIVLDDPQQITKSVLAAIALCGVRAVISPGWGGLDKSMIESAGPNMFALGNVPHDWLFERVSAVCHHGGAGTTAIGLRCGRPTIIVPFFGDQPWWASQIARRGTGPPPITPKQLTAESLAAAIRIALSPQTRKAAALTGETIKQEVLAECGKLNLNDLELHRSREYDTHMAATDVVTGAISPFIKTINDIGRGLAKLPTTRPDKGMVQILGGYTLGGQAVLQGVSEGLHNTPKLYGGEVREIKKVNGVGSGLVEGGKVFAYISKNWAEWGVLWRDPGYPTFYQSPLDPPMGIRTSPDPPMGLQSPPDPIRELRSDQ